MKSVIINSDKSIGYLEDYKGHTLQNVREWDPGTTEKPEGVYVLEFSDEPVQDQLLTIEEQESFFKACKQWAVDGHDTEFRQPCRDVIRRLFSDAGAV